MSKTKKNTKRKRERSGAEPRSKRDRKRAERMVRLWRERKLCLAMDIVFQTAVSDNTDLAQHIVDSVFGKGAYRIYSVGVEEELRSKPTGKAVRMDFLGKDRRGRFINVEMQRSHTKGIVYRVRENQAQIDSHQLNISQGSDELKDTVIIAFVNDGSFFKNNLPKLTVFRTAEETHEKMGDGTTHIYVNLKTKDRHSDVGRLVGELWTKLDECDSTTSQAVTDALQFIQENGGDESMWIKAIHGGPAAVAEYRFNKGVEQGLEEGLERGKQLGREEGVINVIFQMSDNGKSSEEIAKDVNKTVDEVNDILSKRRANNN